MVLVLVGRRLSTVGRGGVASWKNVFAAGSGSVEANLNSHRRPFTNSTMSPQQQQATVAGNGNYFCLNDYHAVGFDLDNTIVRYQVANMVQMEYNTLVEFLVQERGYSGRLLNRPMHEDEDLLQKGLVVDFARGNLVRINRQGTILSACHGRKLLKREEIRAVYGPTCQWSVGKSFAENILGAWNGPMSQKLRNLLDYFDMPTSMIFARIVDTLDEDQGGGRPLPEYNIWPDILDALMHIYSREHFDQKSDYFQAIKCNPGRFIYKIRPEVVAWLKELRKHKTTFLLTGSHRDFAEFTSSYALDGQARWEELFDVIVCFARKPGFFTEQRPFVHLDGHTETDPAKSREELKVQTQFFTQGNTEDLLYMLKQKCGDEEEPRVVYVGDNLIQDVYTPSAMAKWDTVAVVEELLAEQKLPAGEEHPILLDGKLLGASQWGSYFKADNEDSFWFDMIKRHARICVPSLETLAKRPLEHKYKAFGETSSGRFPPDCDGFHF